MKEKEEFRRKGSPGDPGTDPNNRVSGSPGDPAAAVFFLAVKTKPKKLNCQKKTLGCSWPGELARL